MVVDCATVQRLDLRQDLHSADQRWQCLRVAVHRFAVTTSRAAAQPSGRSEVYRVTLRFPIQNLLPNAYVRRPRHESP